MVYAAQQTKTLQRTAIRSPELLDIKKGVGTSRGADQNWYSSWIRRMSGCGPTAASNLLWYLAATRPQQCSSLFDGDGTRREGMLHLMEQVWNYVTPGMRGVDKASMLAEGGKRFGMERGVGIEPRVLEVPDDESKRPSEEGVLDFLSGAFADNLPVAFLNLSSGAVSNLDTWHWVTLVSVDEGLRAEMYDEGVRQWVDLGLWLRTTSKGGAFVALGPAS